MDLARYWAAMSYLESFIRGGSEAPRTRDEHLAQWQTKLPSMEFLLERMGSPHRRFRSVHIGGTSGKGSTATFVASILGAAGYRTGLHTSPYLQAAVEKIAVNGHPIPPQDMADLIEGSKAIFQEMEATGPYGPPAFVQLWTALAFAYFAQRQVDMAVVEVSLGGRFDYTNILAPLAAAITTVDFDHTATLGHTLREIAWHKAGIIKPGTPVVSGVRHQEALEQIQAECVEKRAPLYRIGWESSYSVKKLDRGGATFDCAVPGHTYRDLEITMLGEHQALNASIAVGVVGALRHRDVPVSEDALRQGLREARIPGRLEVVQENPTVILDGAHNPEKASTLRRALEQLFPGKSLVLVLGIGASKDAQEVLRVLAPGARLVLCTAAGVIGKPATLPEQLVREIIAMGVEARVVPEPLAAMEQALAAAGQDTIVCATGSLFLVGALRERWYPVAGILAAAAAAASPTAN
ncbi:MAG TPA: folylpolyglutamate synthase/dihydrofolate synthase family protein [Dehalococcoidia bacterium]|nr:folylpolyglutamate synthase/dihydrofolate synthase family protein [Dehalococcoidia bacterium]